MDDLQYQLNLLRAMNQKLVEKERMYQMICDAGVGAFLYCSFQKQQICTLGEWNNFFDFEIREKKDFSRLLDVVQEEDVMKLRDVLFLDKNGSKKAEAECCLKEKRKWLHISSVADYDDKGAPVDMLISITDVTKLHEYNEELRYLAYYDSLTGLYNRNYFVQLLSEYVRNASETNNIVSVMILDVDDFRKVNDGQGMVIGDELVQQLGFYLKELCNGENMIACRIYSDLFGVAIYGPTADVSVDTIYKSVRNRLKDPFRLSDGREVKITVSAGVAEYPEAAKTSLELLNCAEIVLFKSKDMGKNNIQYFNMPVMDDFLSAIEMENKLKTAIRNENFILYYQPQYFTDTKKLRGVEALIRWQDDDRRFISPATFIPVAEKNGAIIPIGKWVVEQSIKQYSIWREQFGFPFVMSINISALQYKTEDFVDSIVAAMSKYDVTPSEIELEITESVLIDDFQEVYAKLRLLRAYGIKISLDDFGTGFSSLSYLKKLPIDTLKIDKSFIDTVMTDSSSRVILEAIVNMVKALGYESVAEGVEQEDQYEYLKSIGCNIIQGYLFSKPLTPGDMEKLLVSEC